MSRWSREVFGIDLSVNDKDDYPSILDRAIKSLWVEVVVDKIISATPSRDLQMYAMSMLYSGDTPIEKRLALIQQISSDEASSLVLEGHKDLTSEEFDACFEKLDSRWALNILDMCTKEKPKLPGNFSYDWVKMIEPKPLTSEQIRSLIDKLNPSEAWKAFTRLKKNNIPDDLLEKCISRTNPKFAQLLLDRNENLTDREKWLLQEIVSKK